MGRLTRWLDWSLYAEYGDNWDDRLLRERILGALDPGSMTFPTYLVGALYERLVNSLPFLAGNRILLVCKLRKI